MNYNFIDIEPVRTYATVDNARKAVDKRMELVSRPSPERAFNVAIMEHKGRFFPLLCNCNDLQLAIWTGFNVVN